MTTSFVTTSCSRARLLRSGLAAVVAAGLATTTLASAGAAAATGQTPSLDAGRYVVTLVEPPAATYDGGEPGLDATRPDDGEQLAADSADVREYRSYLRGEQADVAASVGADRDESYTAALNGFTADLTAKQATELATSKEVLSVFPDTARSLDTVSTPEYLGLTGKNGVWKSLGGAKKAGSGVVVGVIDTGVWPENPSFAGKKVTNSSGGNVVGKPYRGSDGQIALTKSDGDTFSGACEVGEQWTADLCNSKLVSARYFADGFLASVPPEDRAEFEFISPRDGDGHGSHTASTAAGNNGVQVTIDGQDIGVASGMAPAAKLAVYKVCFTDNDSATGGCYSSDSVAAIDQAVLDGVDVLNYSISGSRTTVVDPVELAFLSAASAGVFVAVSAGNSGPEPSTTAHNSPWLTSVAASTKPSPEGTVVLGNGERYLGAMRSDRGVPAQTPVVLAQDAALDGAVPDEARQCFDGTLDPAVVTGSIVVCDRGAIARTAKSEEVERAGGVGSILLNVTAKSINADLHAVPTVHLPDTDAPQVKAYVSGTADATAALLPGNETDEPSFASPVIAGFSSRGPASANGGDLLKPDISAPGVDIVAAVAPGPYKGRSFDFLSGTSMSSPHVAGLAALYFQRQPTWSPMQVKSAMMTTAYNLLELDGSTSTEVFAQGAGHVDPTRFFDPGLVYDSGPDDWLAFIQGTGTDLAIPGLEGIDPSDLNQPSIAIGQLAGTQTVTREVTAVTPGLYRADADMPGMDVTITPPVLNFTGAGETKTFEVTIRRTTDPLGEYAEGYLTWSGGNTTARIPMVARSTAVAAPTEIVGAGPSGSLDYEVTPGMSGPIDLSLYGLTPGQVFEDTVTPGPAAIEGNASTDVYTLDVAEGSTLARFDLQAGDEGDDLDLYIITPSGSQLKGGTTGAASERIDALSPDAGTYTVLVNGYATTDGLAAEYALRLFAVGDGPAGNAILAPDPLQAVQGQPATVTLRWSGLQTGVPYLGWVGYEGAQTPTIVTIEADPDDEMPDGSGG